MTDLWCDRCGNEIPYEVDVVAWPLDGAIVCESCLTAEEIREQVARHRQSIEEGLRIGGQGYTQEVFDNLAEAERRLKWLEEQLEDLERRAEP